jgi:Cdc6-like AAA superfamily ATPase
MSIKLLAAELARFLRSAEPEVLCITGKWGVGKTYSWNHYLRQAQDNNNVKLKKYAYVSLFGRNSLDDVRTAIVENTVDSQATGEKPDLKSFKSAVAELRSLAGPFAKLASFIPSAAG